MAMVVIYVLTNDNENVECTSGTKLKFAVIGSQWYGRIEAIASFNECNSREMRKIYKNAFFLNLFYNDGYHTHKKVHLEYMAMMDVLSNSIFFMRIRKIAFSSQKPTSTDYGATTLS